MPIYETVFIARGELSAKQVETLTDDMGAIAKKLGAKIIKTEQWGLRTLAYPINKAKKAYYALIEMETVPAALLEMERNMRLHEDIVRYLTVRLDEPSKGPSPVLNKDRDAEIEIEPIVEAA